MSIVVTGGNGTLAQALRPFLPEARYLSRAEWDVTKAVPIMDIPEVIIHAAAVTDHQHPNAAEIIETNVVGTERIARFCRTWGIKLVYLSTHYVYPGEVGNYKESDATRPIGTYAWSKLAGEGWAEIVPNHLIVRGSWYSHAKLERMAHGALTDAWGNRERPCEAAKKIAMLIDRGAEGTFNIGGERRTFYELCLAEGITAKPLTRADINGSLPYLFPVNCTVNTAKFDAFIR